MAGEPWMRATTRLDEGGGSVGDVVDSRRRSSSSYGVSPSTMTAPRIQSRRPRGRRAPAAGRRGAARGDGPVADARVRERPRPPAAVRLAVDLEQLGELIIAEPDSWAIRVAIADTGASGANGSVEGSSTTDRRLSRRILDRRRRSGDDGGPHGTCGRRRREQHDVAARPPVRRPASAS